MANIGDGFKNIFLAGIGALAYTGEKSKEVIEQLVEKGEITLEQSRELNDELQRKTTETTTSIRDGALEARMKVMTPEERNEFAAKAAEIAQKQNEADANKTVEADAVIIETEPVEEAEPKTTDEA